MANRKKTRQWHRAYNRSKKGVARRKRYVQENSEHISEYNKQYYRKRRKAALMLKLRDLRSQLRSATTKDQRAVLRLTIRQVETAVSGLDLVKSPLRRTA